MNQKEKKDILRKIKNVWNKAEYSLNNRSFSDYGCQLLQLTRFESKRHDNFRGESIRRGMTITEEAKYFALTRLCAYLWDLDKQPDIRSYHHCQKSIYMAYALAKEFEVELKEIISLDYATELFKVDYCVLIAEPSKEVV